MGTLPLPPITLRYTGLFDFDGLYAAVIDWAKNYGYRWHEKAYKHKVPSPAGAEQEFEWEITRNVTDYINYTISFTVHVWDLREMVVENKILSNGRISILIEGKINYDWQKKFSGGKFMRWLGVKYETNVKKEVESVHFDQLYYTLWNLHALMKKFFDIQTKKHLGKRYLGE